ncbi:MAG: hypothetical protein LBT14_11780, partial [Treponema sp.]|nr:hypothetical protein [Treponema sp.]
SSLVFQRPLRGIIHIPAIALEGSPSAFNNVCSAMQVFSFKKERVQYTDLRVMIIPARNFCRSGHTVPVVSDV